MTIPKGTGWQHIRSLCFDAIPAEANAYHLRAPALDDWRVKGAFQITACNKKSITIETAGVELGSALLTDAEHLLDHAAEQHATIRSFITEPGWHSPAWAIVTGYYWAFFSAMAITRLTGKTTWFLQRDALANFRQLAGATEQPAAGALHLAVGPYISATTRQAALSPIRLHLHDAHWNTFHELVAAVSGYANQTASPFEYRLFRCLHDVGARLGPNWPSEVRNRVNYRPGLAYREVIRDGQIDATVYIRRKRNPFTSEKLISDFEDEVLKIKQPSQGAQDIPLLCRLLILFAIAVATVARELHSELIDRNSNDRRWSDLRRRFLQQRCPADEAQRIWPLGDS